MDESNLVLNFLECVSNESGTSTIVDSKTEKYHKTNYTSENVKKEKDTSYSKMLNESFDDNRELENNEIILSIYWKRGKLGAAYYNIHTSEMHLLNDIIDIHPDFCNSKVLLNQVQPNQIIICGGLPDTFIKCLSNAMNELHPFQNEETFGSSKNIIFMSAKKKDLGYESCKRHILGLKLGFEPEPLNEDDHILFVNSHIDLAQESMVISLGMLIKYLEKYLPRLNLSCNSVQINFLNQISLENLVSVDEITYKALQIFNSKVHPSPFKRNSRSNKEGLSLYRIFSRCRSIPGMKKMKEIFMHPSKNIEKLEERLDAIDFCIKPQHQHIVQNLLDCIKRVDAITGVLGSLYRTRTNISHWKSLYKSIYNAILIGEICQMHSSSSKLLKKVANSINQNIHEVAHYINRIIDFEESSAKNHFIVREGVNAKLDSLKKKYAQIPEVLVRVAEIELRDLPEFIEQCSITYITELGYLLSVPVWAGDDSSLSKYALSNFEIKFIVNGYIYYKTHRCKELDKVLGDSPVFISEMESKIMIMLIEFIHQRIPDLVKSVELIAELDCAISFAIVAAENNYCRPCLTKERKLEVIQGRHPLQELCVDNFVPNDLKFGSNDKFIKILTGPNSSGKSVYLKQVGLITYLAHIGSFVPAQSCIVGVLDHIHSRVQSTESSSTRMSAFLLDLKQMSLSLYNSSSRSLIIVDEFGKGTTEIDGISLYAATLMHFLERKENCPYILASTHFHRLPQMLPLSPLLHFQCMDYLIQNEEGIYLHKIKDGTSGSSLTHLAARAAGLSEEAIKRSKVILEGTTPLEPDSNLEITKSMLNEIENMKKMFSLPLLDKFGKSDQENII